MSSGSKAVKKGSYPSNTFDAIYPGTSQKVSFTATSAQSAAFGAGISVARFYSDQDCYLAFGTNPTALTDGTSLFLPGGVELYLGVNPADKVAVIRATASGTLYITEGAS